MNSGIEVVGRSGGVAIERREALAIVRLMRPDARVNPLSVAVMRDLIAAARRLEDDDAAAVVVTGRPDIFSAGLDLRDAESHELVSADLDRRRALAETGRRLLDALAGLAPVTIAAIEGPCLGGGLAVATALDFRIAGRSARLGAPEVSVGLNMGWGSLALLAAVAGVQATRRLVLAGEALEAHEALGLGLLDRVVEDGAALDAALALAERLAAFPRAPLRMAKRAIAALVQASGAATALDVDQFVAAASSEAFAASLRAFRRP